MKKFKITILISIVCQVCLYGAPISCISAVITQPDGTCIFCFYSGDEFRGMYHDADGYPIIRNDKGYYCYAIFKSYDDIKVTDYIVGEVDPKLISELEPNFDSCTPPDIQNFLGKYSIEYITLVNKGDGYKEVEGASGAYEIEIIAYQDVGIQFFFDKRGINGYVKATVSPDGSCFNIFDQAFPSYTHSPRTVISGTTGNLTNGSISMSYQIYNVNDENIRTEDSLYFCRGKKIIPEVSTPFSGSGKLVCRGNLCTTDPCLPCVALWLETTDGNYYLINLCGTSIIVNDVEYSEGDEVEITGTATTKYDINSDEYFVLEIGMIKKTNIGVSYISASGLLAAYPQDNGIVVQNIPKGEVITVYNVAGIVVATAIAGECETFIPLSVRGIYIVKAAGKVVKAMF